MLLFMAFNGFMLLLAIGVVAKVISVQFLTGFITGLHYTMGISTPTQDQVRRAVMVWIISIVIIVDILFSLLRWAF
jgi:hypothetical protein